MLSVILLRAELFNACFAVQLCLLKQLSILDLSHKKISAPLPSCSSKLSFMSTVEKSIGIPSLNVGSGEYSLADIPRADIGGRDFNPGSATTYPTLSVEEVVEFTTKRNTYKYKGYILNFMSAIDLSCINRFTGEIPSEFGSLGEIHALNLSHNNLTGSIQATLSNLKQIESLDLCHSNLNGGIPPQLSALYTLEVFCVAFNNLSGKTPELKDQFGTFDESNCEGNPFLCGPPLRSNCGEIESEPSTPMPDDSNGEREDDGPIDTNIFYISFGISYIIVVLVIVAVLCINSYWRRAWFYLIEACIGTCYYFVLDSFYKLSSFRWLEGLCTSFPPAISSSK